eukprot:Phypoly_transcript_14320.p1 GENE.Phypoly_transcript_14320~~Phypoly_transcript_14320.p1  ORF type:complete len:217 (+),score=27.35 Phypoly_transcript_14320:2-652(+)
MPIDEKYKESNKLLMLVRGDLELLETGKDTSVFLQGRLTTNLNQLSRVTNDLSSLVGQQPGLKRELWRIRVKQLVEDCKTARQSMEGYLKVKYAKDKDEEDRRKLLERHNANPTNMKSLEDTRASIRRSHQLADNIKNIGLALMHSLGEQNETLKNSQRKLWDIANKLGFSQRLIRNIQRRHAGDRILVFSGMILTLFILFVLWGGVGRREILVKP